MNNVHIVAVAAILSEKWDERRLLLIKRSEISGGGEDENLIATAVTGRQWAGCRQNSTNLPGGGERRVGGSRRAEYGECAG
jgi:hypothetical protein